MDIFATLCEAAGVKPPAGIDGVSFLPTLLGRPAPESPPDRYFVLREGGPSFGGKTSNALIQGDWKLLQDRPFLPRELYNLRLDPQESTDLAAREPKRVPDARCGDAQAHPAGRPGALAAAGRYSGSVLIESYDNRSTQSILHRRKVTTHATAHLGTERLDGDRGDCHFRDEFFRRRGDFAE